MQQRRQQTTASQFRTRTQITHRLQNIIKSQRFTKAYINITPQERTTIKSLKCKNLVYLPSDKGGQFCVIEKERYDEAALQHLHDTTTYRASRITSAQTIERKINTTWRNITDNTEEIPPYIARSYITNNSSMPRFYHLIKTHKPGPDIKIRPIVSSTMIQAIASRMPYSESATQRRPSPPTKQQATHRPHQRTTSKDPSRIQVPIQP